MYASWIKDVDKQQLVGACLIDLSAAFDVVDAELLVAKFGLYNFAPKTTEWITSYMFGHRGCWCTTGIHIGAITLRDLYK